MIIRYHIKSCATASFARGMFFGALISLLFFVSMSSEAHGPFDNSVHAILRSDALEVSIAMGGEAAGEILNRASPKKPTWLGGMGLKTLPTELAAHFIEIKSGATLLAADQFTVAGDGLEYTFTATFPIPTDTAIAFRAPYFDMLEQMKLGTLVLTDEAGRQIGSGLFTKGSASVELTLPQQPQTAVATQEPTSRPSTLAATMPTRVEQNSPSQTQRPSFGQFIALGIGHIVDIRALDHVLFLCALLVVCREIKPTIAVITCFTLAHSVTLALAALDIMTISARVVEPLIAASIVFVGIENFRKQIDLKKRCALTFGFGLVHGLGLAQGLRESGLGGTPGQLAAQLLGFNFGVELGQMTIAAVFLPVLFLARRSQAVERFTTPAISAVVIALGGFWLVQRLLP